MDKKDIKIGQKVWVIKMYGTIEDGFDMQILDYEVGWIGKNSIIIKHYKEHNEPELDFWELYPTLEEAMETIKNAPYFKDKEVRFEKIYGNSYNVRWNK